MGKNYGLFYALIVMLVLGLACAGCGDSDVDDENGPDSNGASSPETGDEDIEKVDVDFSDPEAVALAFWEDLSKGNFDRTAQYLTADARVDFNEFREEYETNSYIMDLWKLIAGSSDATVTGTGSSGNWTIINLELKQPDYDSLVATPQGEALLMEIFMLLHLSGFDLGEMMGDAPDMGDKTFSEADWNAAISEFEEAVMELPKRTETEQIELIEENGQWKVDDLPLTDLF